MTKYPALREAPRNAPTPLGPPGTHFSFLDWLRQQGRLIEREPGYDKFDEERPIETIDDYLEPDDRDRIDLDFDGNEDFADFPYTDSDGFGEDDSAETAGQDLEPRRQDSQAFSTNEKEHQEGNQEGNQEVQESDINTLELTQKSSEDESTNLNKHQDLVSSALGDESNDYCEDPEFMTEEVKAQITRIDQHIVQLLEWSNQYNLFFEQNIKVDHTEEHTYHTHENIHVIEGDKSNLKSLIHQIGRRIEAIESAKREISDSISYLDRKLDRYQDEVLEDLKAKHANLKISVTEGFEETIRCHLSDTLQEDLLPGIQKYLSEILKSNNEEISESEKVDQLKASLQEALEAFEQRKDKVVDRYIETLQARNEELEQENETIEALRISILEKESANNKLIVENNELLDQVVNLEGQRERLKQDYSHSITEAGSLQQQIKELQEAHQQDLEKAQVGRQELTADLDTYKRLVTEREQQLQVLRDSLAASLTQLTEHLDSAEAEETSNSSDGSSSDAEPIDFAGLRQSLLIVSNSLQAIPSVSTALVTQIRHVEEQLALQAQHLQDLTQARDAFQHERDSARAELAACRETLNAEVADKNLLAGKLQALEAKYTALEEKHHQSISEQGKLQERITHLERSEQAQREAQQKCQDKLRETQQQLEEERKKPKLFNPFNRSKANTTQDS